MTYSIRFLPSVEDDAVAGYLRYESKVPGLGEEFLRLLYARAGEIPEDPLLYRKVHGEFRRRLLRRFPYAIYFRIEGNEVVVFGVFHCARNPATTTGELESRDLPETP
jgi:hypothetical protein